MAPVSDAPDLRISFDDVPGGDVSRRGGRGDQAPAAPRGGARAPAIPPDIQGANGRVRYDERNPGSFLREWNACVELQRPLRDGSRSVPAVGRRENVPMAVANDGRRKRKDFSRRLENPGQPRLDRPRE